MEKRNMKISAVAPKYLFSYIQKEVYKITGDTRKPCAQLFPLKCDESTGKEQVIST
jgi:hypothetical protein